MGARLPIHLSGRPAIVVAAPLSVVTYLAHYACAFNDDFSKACSRGDLLWSVAGGPSIAACGGTRAITWLSGFLLAAASKKYRWTGLALGALTSAVVHSLLAWIFWDVQGISSVWAGAFTFMVSGCGWLLPLRGAAPRVAFLSVAGLAFWVLLILGQRLLSLSPPSAPGLRAFTFSLDWASIFLIGLPALPFIAAWAIVSRPPFTALVPEQGDSPGGSASRSFRSPV